MSTEEKFEQLIGSLPDSVKSTLRPSANSGAIQVANSRIESRGVHFELPQSVVDLWLLHDGQNEGDDLFPDFAFLPIGKAIGEYGELCGMLRENDPYYDDPDPYAPKKELWEKWFDPILFPIGWTPGGSGCLFLIHLQNEQIWRFNPDGGLGGRGYESVDDLLQKTIESLEEESGDEQ